MKKSKRKNKLALAALGAAIPLSVSGIALSAMDVSKANAVSTAQYTTGHVEQVSLSNNNFNSSSSTFSLSTSLTGWSGRYNNGKTTAGIINVGNTFQTYMADTYYLGNNPFAKANDKYILMINSKTKNSKVGERQMQSYTSNNVSLAANSYYSFQVSFISDTNYNSHTVYENVRGHIGDISGTENGENFSIDASTFNAQGKDFDLDNPQYISFSYGSFRNIYLRKELQESAIKLSSSINDVKFFYEDANFVGFMYGENGDQSPIYIKKDEHIQTIGEGTEKVSNIVLEAGEQLTTYVCQFQFKENSDPEAKTYKITYRPGENNAAGRYYVDYGTPFFSASTARDSINDFTFGSIYLDGLKDKDGKPIEVKFEKISSKSWVTLYFFVATGDEAQTVNLDLWLGTNKEGSTGVVFFDDVKIYQYSENEFWKTYQNYYGKSFTQSDEANGTETKYPCVEFVNLRTPSTFTLPESSNLNFNFEKDITGSQTTLIDWKATGEGHAQVFNTSDSITFKNATGYDYVGSDLSCEVELDGNKVELINNNKYLLGLWTKNNSVKVTSNNFDIMANEIYKITVQYRVVDISSGNAYIFVKENDSKDSAIKKIYNLSDGQYNFTGETASSGFSSNTDNNFVNDYTTVEFYVKGGAHYNSTINLSLGLGTDSESSTGCVLFDNITVSHATSEEFTNATNKMELDVKNGDQSITNGNFRATSTGDSSTYPYSADSWEVSGEEKTYGGITGKTARFAGVINTDSNQYNVFNAKYNELKNKGVSDIENPYAWASTGNPRSPSGEYTPNNVMMLANIESTWQTLKSPSFSFEAGKEYKLSFDFKTNIAESKKLKISICVDENFKLYEEEISTNTSWDVFNLYFKTPSNLSQINAYILIELGDEKAPVSGWAYFDNFELEEESIPSDRYAKVVDMTDDFSKLGKSESNGSFTNNPAYDAKATGANGDGYIGGLINKNAFKKNGEYYSDGYYEFETEPEKDDVFFMSGQGKGSYEIRSKFGVTLSADTYYALTFKVRTKFVTKYLDSDKTYSYGVSVGLSGYKLIENIRTNESDTTGDKYKEYTVYFNVSEETTANYIISITLPDTDETTLGSAVVYDLKLTSEPDDTNFSAAQKAMNDKNFDVNENRVFASSLVDSTDDETETPDDNKTETDSENNNFDWLLIPTLITGLAIVIAVVGYFMRKIKLKKIEIKRKETYDRKSSLNVDAIKHQAAQERDAEVAELSATISKFEKELESIEQEHKKKVVSLREKDKGKVSKETDKEFKQFAQKRTVLAEKLDSLNSQMEELKSPEHLLNLERKVYAKEEAKRRSLEKSSKKANKQKEAENKPAKQTKKK